MKASPIQKARIFEIQDKTAILAPSLLVSPVDISPITHAAPSKNWWNTMTMSKVFHPGPESAPRVTPIMMLVVQRERYVN